MCARAAILAALLLLAPAHAQTTEPAKDELSVSAMLGWQGKMVADRWAPITLMISPGDAPLSGVVHAEYPQGTGTARFTAPFAATPGKTTPVQVLVSLPEFCQRLVLTLVDDAGRTRWSQTYEGIRSAAWPLPAMFSVATPVVAVVGRTSLFEAIRDWPGVMSSWSISEGGGVPSAGLDHQWVNAASVRAEVATLPTSWIGYESLAALVVVPDSSDPPDVRAVEAIHTWIASGGHLIVRADAPGDAWRTWIPDSLSRGITVAGSTTVSVPDAAKTVIERTASRVRTLQANADAATGVAGISGPPPIAADTMLARPISVEPAGPWKAHWSGAGASAQPSLIAQARRGFGSITLMGFDPARCTTVLSTIGAGAVWREALEPAMKEVLIIAAGPSSARAAWAAAPMSPQDATNTALERLAQVPGIASSIFLLIVICLLGLALLVGPIDYFLLRRLRSLQRSWLTAITWIALASAAAFAGPRLIRTEPTHLRRLSVEDCIALPVEGGTPVAASTASIGGPISFRTGVTGIYSGDSGIARFTKPDPASWWRGITVRYANQAPPGGSGLIPIAQRAAGGASGSRRGGPLTELPIALWTFRSFADESDPAPTIRSRIRATQDGWSVLIAGLPSTAKVVRAALRTGDNWCTLDGGPRYRPDITGSAFAQPSTSPNATPPGSFDNGVWTAQFRSNLSGPGAPLPWSEVDLSNQSYDFGAESTVDERPGVLTCLSGPARRSRGIDGVLKSGAWAAVYLELAELPVDTPIDWPTKELHSRILRILAPIEDRP